MKKCSRREFLEQALKLGLGATALPALGLMPAFAARGAPDPAVLKEALYYRKLPDGKLQCTLCPNQHTYKDGEFSYCRTRCVIKGKMYTLAYNNPCTLNIDPIEKGPFYHIRPNTNALGIALGGCNLRCAYCQNWDISQKRPDELKNIDFTKADALKWVNEKECKTILWSYTDPAVYPEYLLEVAGYTAKEGIKNAICTAGFISQQPLKDICKVSEAFAVTLKAFNDKFYQEVCGQTSYKPVLQSLETIKAEGKWLEVVNLIIPSYNDNMDEIKEMCKWLVKNLGPDTPLHVGRFVPSYKLNSLPMTPVKTVEQARQIGLDAGLKFVYAFNVAPHEGNYTYCPKCGKTLIKRLAFKVLENVMVKGACPGCGQKIPGIWS
ncbi:MAG: AmmeMemoRadiSam system radical SAM enzyme [Candidatus Brocadiia bacterium]